MRKSRQVGQWRHGLIEVVQEGHRLGAHHLRQRSQHRGEVAHDQARPAACRVLVARRAGFFHGIACVGQRLRSTPHRRRHFRIGAAARWLRQDGNANGPGQRRSIEWRVDRPGVAWMRTHQYAQAEPHIGYAAGHRALHVHQLHGQQMVFGRHITRIGYAPRGRSDRCDAAGVGRIAQRTADVVAQADRTHAAGQRRRLAAAGAAGGAAGVPGISSQTVQRAIGVNTQRHVWQIGAGDRYRAGSAHAFDHRRVRWHHGLRQRRHAPGGWQPGHVDIFLYREGHAMQRADRLAGGQLLVGQDSAGAGLVGKHPHHGVQRRVHCIDASQVRIHRFHRTQLPTRNALRQFGGRELPNLAHQCPQDEEWKVELPPPGGVSYSPDSGRSSTRRQVEARISPQRGLASVYRRPPTKAANSPSALPFEPAASDHRPERFLFSSIASHRQEIQP